MMKSIDSLMRIPGLRWVDGKLDARYVRRLSTRHGIPPISKFLDKRQEKIRRLGQIDKYAMTEQIHAEVHTPWRKLFIRRAERVLDNTNRAFQELKPTTAEERTYERFRIPF